MPTFEKISELDVSARDLFAWHARQGAFERLGPPWEIMQIRERVGSIRDGDRLVFAVKKGPLYMPWEAHHQGFIEHRQFQDVQVRGPFSSWVHTHRFEERGDSKSALHDHIEYTLPLSPLGELAAGWFVRDMLNQMFDFRHRRTMQDLSLHQPYADRPRKKIAVSGATGLIGAELCALLTTGGHEVFTLVRRAPQGPHEIQWSPTDGVPDPSQLAGLDAIIHLAGENIADARWSDDFKRRVLKSREEGTSKLAQAIASLPEGSRPKALLCASAVGFYGPRGDEVITEHDSRGEGFLADVCEVWERSCGPAADAGVRVVNLRIGIVLSPRGGALSKMLTPFKLGVGGRMGSGQQYMSWIAIDDVVGAIHHALWHDELSGPVNLTAPNPATNAALSSTLGATLGRPALIPTPAFALKLAMGEQMAQELLLSGQRVMPTRLIESGYTFLYPELPAALAHLLGA
jgi:uncharacterized protein (TIGR01777 family)